MEVSGLKGLPYQTLGLLGTGGFAEVFKVRYVHTGELYALKRIKKYRLNDPRAKEQIDREISLMKGMDHPHIIKMIDSFQTEEEIFLVLELADSNLYDKLQQYGSFPENRVVSYMKQLVSALQYLHNRQLPIVHRDLKPENLLVDKEDRIKLSDFGSANQMEASGTRITYAGTMIYMAPQMVTNQPYNTSLDMWNVGLIIYEFLTGQNPFQKARDMVRLQSMILNTELTFPSYFPVLARDVVKRLLKKNPQQRMTLLQLKRHVWLNIEMEDYLYVRTPFNIRESKKYEDALNSIKKLKQEMVKNKEEEEEIQMIKLKIAERRRECQLMALSEPDHNYVGLREQLYQLKVQMHQNQIKIKKKYEQMMKGRQKMEVIQQKQKKQIEEYQQKIAKLKELPVKKYMLVKNQLKQAVSCMNELTHKMEILPQNIKNDLEYIRQPRKPNSKPMINLQLTRMTVQLLRAQYNALVQKKQCLIRQQSLLKSKNSEQSINSI